MEEKKEEGKIRLILLWLGKNWKTWVPILVSIIALSISLCSNKTASDANRIAKDTYETSKYQFLQVNRPYIIISPKRFDNKQFWQIKQEGENIKIALMYEMKNAGNVTAKDIMLPDKATFISGKKLLKDDQVRYYKSGKVTLGPGDTFNIYSNIALEKENEEAAKKDYEHLVSDKSYGVDVSLSVNYTNELDETQRYKTFVQYRIHKNKAQLIKSETLILSDENLTK